MIRTDLSGVGANPDFDAGTAFATSSMGKNQKTQEIGLLQITAAGQSIQAVKALSPIMATPSTAPRSLISLLEAHSTGEKTADLARKELPDSTWMGFIELADTIQNKFKIDPQKIKGMIQSFFKLTEGEFFKFREPFFRAFASLKKPKSLTSPKAAGGKDHKSDGTGKKADKPLGKCSDHPLMLLEPDFVDPDYQPNPELQVFILNCISDDIPPFEYSYIFNPVAVLTETVLDQTLAALTPCMKRFATLRLGKRLYLPELASKDDLEFAIRHFKKKGIAEFYIRNSSFVEITDIEQLTKAHDVKIHKKAF